LAAYYFWKDQQGLTQALLVAKHNRIDLDDIKRWSKASGNLQGFKTFQEKYSEKK
jgi:hypothetical protein